MASFIIFGGGTILENTPGIASGAVRDNCKKGNSWQFIQPVETTNYVLNPSAEVENQTARGAAVVGRSSTYQKYGLYSFVISAANAGDGVLLDIDPDVDYTLASSVYYLTLAVRGDTLDLMAELAGSAAVAKLQVIEQIDTEWTLLGCSFQASLAGGMYAVGIYTANNGLFDLWIDGVQLEPLPYRTTYCDGTQEGCEWKGIPHNSSSSRSGQSRAGGRILDFYDDFGFFVKKIVGAGAAPLDVSIDPYAIIPGGILNNIKTQVREFSIVGEFRANSEPDLHAKRSALALALSDELYPNSQPFKLRFTGSSAIKEISVHYKAGLEGDLAAFYRDFEAGDDTWVKRLIWNEKATIQLSSPDPFWYGVGETAALLNFYRSAEFELIVAKPKSTGLWDTLGPPANTGTYNSINDLAEDDNYVYIAGFFTDWNGVGGVDHIVRYEKATGLYSAMGSGLNQQAKVLAMGNDNKLYVGGLFTLAGGIADTAYIAYWDTITEDWHPLGTGMDSDVYAIGVGLDGKVYAGGNFTSAGGNTNCNLIGYWDGSWNAMDVGVNSIVRAIGIGQDNRIYVCGDFTLANAVSMPGVGYWDVLTATWFGMPDPSMQVLCITIGTGNKIIIGGMGGVMEFTGGGWSILGNNVGDVISGQEVDVVKFGPDGVLYIGGGFSHVGPLYTADSFVRWNGSSYSHVDLDLPGSGGGATAVLAGKVDPVIKQNYDLYVGTAVTGTGALNDKTIVSYRGTAPAFPKIVFTRSGIGTAVIESIKNLRTGLEILFDYSLLDNETLVVDLKPTNKSIVSSFFSSRLDAVLGNSNFGNWSLLPGDNPLTAFIAITDDAIPSVYLLWRNTYKSWD